ncbi:response regulator [Oscillospiraceae bacterium 38-13]
MKLLIVDDEKIVRDSIRLIIEREGLTGIDLMAVATGGAAIEAAGNFRPDAIFMDIDMPGLNGLEAIQSIQKFAPEVIIVIITAYDVFQYAQTAIRYGVYEYLLKPFTPSKIVELLDRVQKKLQSGVCLQKRVIQLREEVASMRTAVNHGILNMMITQTGMLSVLEKELELDETAGRILLVSVTEEDARLQAARQMRKYKSQWKQVMVSPFIRGQAVMFAPRGAAAHGLWEMLASALAPEVFCVSCGLPQEELGQLWISYHQAIEAMHTQSGTFRVYRQEEKFLPERIEVFRKLAECCLDGEDGEPLISDILQRVTDPQNLQQSILQTSHLVMLLAEVLYSRSQSNLRFSGVINHALAGVMMAGNVAEVQQEFQALARELRQEHVENRTKADSQTVQGVLRYIDRNLEKNITIESAARHLKISSGTLGRAMREGLGKSFVTVLTEARIQRAITLIQSGVYSMKEICFMVGYNDPNYFSRVFKRVTGENPSAYR